MIVSRMPIAQDWELGVGGKFFLLVLIMQFLKIDEMGYLIDEKP